MTKARDLADNALGSRPRLIDAAGDLIYGTGSDAATRLAIGTASQVLQLIAVLLRQSGLPRVQVE
jgi:hypothetical protein